MNKRGVALILCYLVVVVLTILSTTSILRSLSEGQLVDKYLGHIYNYRLAEQGLEEGYYNLISHSHITKPEVYQVGGAQGCQIEVTAIPGYPANYYQITSTPPLGSVPAGVSPVTIRAVVELPNVVLPQDSITAGVMTTAGLSITGSAQIIPEGSFVTNSALTFESVFGVSKETLKSMAEHFIGPGGTPMGITWVDLNGDTPETATTFSLPERWGGSGLLIIDGHRNDATKNIPALSMSRGIARLNGDYFQGMIWVMGTVEMSGYAEINGGIFVETAIDTTSTISGNAIVDFNKVNIAEGFNLFNPPPPGNILSWNEL